MAEKIVRKITKKTKKSKAPTDASVSLEIDLSQVLREMINGYGVNSSDEGKKAFMKSFTSYLQQEISKDPIGNDYNIVILFDNTTLAKVDSDQIYRAVTTFNNTKPMLLIVLSRGGDPGAAYLIGKLCQEFANKKLVATIPRYAKSAATLLCCAADEIHMGGLSELGPIDPQIDSMPTLGLKNSIEHIAELIKKTPESGEMFAKYLNLSVKPVQIGYYERVAESAVQYAEKLLQNHHNPVDNAIGVAVKLVYGYKDHGFVIDKTEAEAIFGKDIIKTNTPEYRLGNRIYEILSAMEEFAGILKYRFYHIGSITSEPTLNKK